MSSNVPNYSLEIFRGEAKNFEFTVYSAAGAVQNIAGWSVSFAIEYMCGGVVWLKTVGDGVTLTTPASGVLTVALDEDDSTVGTENSTQTFRFTLARTDDGSETVLADGKLKIKRNSVLPV